MPAMADLNDAGRNHQRTKSSVLRSFIGGHKRNNSDGSGLASSALAPAEVRLDLGLNTNMDYFTNQQPEQYAPLSELQRNRQEQPQRSPEKVLERGPSSPTKSVFSTISLKSLATRDSSKPKDSSPAKPKKVKSSTNLGGLLSRPKSMKNLKQLLTDEDSRRTKEKDKENRTPPSSTSDHIEPPPIYLQFASQQLYADHRMSPAASPRVERGDPFTRQPGSATERPAMKPRPKSFQYYGSGQQNTSQSSADSRDSRSKATGDENGQKRQTWGKEAAPSRPGIRHAFSGLGLRTKSSASVAREPLIDPKDIDKHLEAMLDRRNIPENQRYKMRNLNDTIKMEFIRQDWAETHQKLERPRTNGSETSTEGGGSASVPDQDDTKKTKHSRGRSWTLARSNNKAPSSPTKKQKGDSSLGRHFRTKSTDSIASDCPSTTNVRSSSPGGSVSKGKGQQGPSDFVSYLRKVQQPQLVEVGKLHKLRLLLRNETVAWTEEFIRQGGMKEIVELLHRIMAVEWREEHEDALLHENLLCLKALCTTALALQYLHSIHTTLFPALLHMIFDPEKKGPSEFTTRNIITSVLLTYIECSTPHERVVRAQTVLGFLRDPEPKEEERPVAFVLDMRRERPYRVWCREVVSVTKEVFWIFLHNLNVIALQSDKSSATATTSTSAAGLTDTSSGIYAGAAKTAGISDGQLAYMTCHFPQERPPVPAAPYVGGVEWDATNYLASHLDLMNAILACTGPTAEDRNALRAELRISGWERCLGGSLRMCKEKFYGSVHDGLRTWVAAAAEDGWDVRDVRYGLPPESRSNSPVKHRPGGGGGKKAKEEAPPRLEMPKLGVGLVTVSGGGGAERRSNDDPWF
ncbi:armadillo-type protein [Apodospora peruviana]|uniref:Armadillo-type protein n=1 Tax=Apodospora peruviana TaxID=516989 RepID=A0AAE0I1A9_9PEZI|nr:armadillo-type protein [Apodospora peruviana]